MLFFKKIAQLRTKMSENNIELSINPLEQKVSTLKIADKDEIELDWHSSRKTCACSRKEDSNSCKLNCSRCGIVYCEHCVEDGKYVTSFTSSKLVFTCKNCLPVNL